MMPRCSIPLAASAALLMIMAAAAPGLSAGTQWLDPSESSSQSDAGNGGELDRYSVAAVDDDVVAKSVPTPSKMRSLPPAKRSASLENADVEAAADSAGAHLIPAEKHPSRPDRAAGFEHQEPIKLDAEYRAMNPAIAFIGNQLVIYWRKPPPDFRVGGAVYRITIFEDGRFEVLKTASRDVVINDSLPDMCMTENFLFGNKPVPGFDDRYLDIYKVSRKNPLSPSFVSETDMQETELISTFSPARAAYAAPASMRFDPSSPCCTLWGPDFFALVRANGAYSLIPYDIAPTDLLPQGPIVGNLFISAFYNKPVITFKKLIGGRLTDFYEHRLSSDQGFANLYGALVLRGMPVFTYVRVHVHPNSKNGDVFIGVSKSKTELKTIRITELDLNKYTAQLSWLLPAPGRNDKVVLVYNITPSRYYPEGSDEGWEDPCGFYLQVLDVDELL